MRRKDIARHDEQMGARLGVSRRQIALISVGVLSLAQTQPWVVRPT